MSPHLISPTWSRLSRNTISQMKSCEFSPNTNLRLTKDNDDFIHTQKNISLTNNYTKIYNLWTIHQINNLIYSSSIKTVIITTMLFGYTILKILTYIFTIEFLHFRLLVLTENIYPTLKTVFHHIYKHHKRKFIKYNLGCMSYFWFWLLSVWKCGKTQSLHGLTAFWQKTLKTPRFSISGQ